MRILFVLAHFYPYLGGAEYLFKRLTEGLAQKGYEVRVITTHLPGTTYFEKVNGVEIERVRTPRLARQYVFSAFASPAVVKRAFEYDLIHTSSNYSAAAAFLGAKLSGKPLVFTCNEVLGQRWRLVEPHQLKAWVYRSVEKVVVKLPYDRYVAISQATHEDVIRAGVNPSKSRVVYCGIDEVFSLYKAYSSDGRLRAQYGINKEDFLYVYFGRPGMTKGVEYLVRAAPLIQREIPNAHLALILAEEPRRQYLHLRTMIEALGPEAKIHLIPPAPEREQLARYLKEANCVVVPSLTEGFGLTTAEVCTLGIPVVASRVGSIPEVISGQHILVEPASPEAICAGVTRAWRGQYDQWKMPKNFSWARMISEYEEVYHSVLDKHIDVLNGREAI